MKSKLITCRILVVTALCFSLALPANGQWVEGCLPPPTGLTAWWPGDGNTDDIIGGRNATLHADASIGLGFVKEAFLLHGDGDFDGDGDFVSVPDDPALNFGTANFTIDLWAFFSDPGRGEQVLIEKYIQRQFPPPASTGWTLTKLEGNELGLFMSSADGRGQGAASAPLAIPAGIWMHFAATRRDGLITLFVNGERVATEFSPEGNINVDSTSSLKFGHRGGTRDTPGADDDQGFFLSGGIDEVEIFVGRALTQGQIQAIYNAGRRGKCKVL